MNSYPKIAAAVAAVLGAAGSGMALAAPPTLTDAAGAVGDRALYISGASAAKNAILVAAKSLLGGAANTLTVTSTGNTNWLSVSGVPAAESISGIVGADGTSVYSIYYRFEGGSVTGVLPLATGVAVNQLNLNDTANITYTAGSATATAAVGGTSLANGRLDSFTGAVTKVVSELGIADVEPALFIGNSYPPDTVYATSVWGVATPTQLGNLAHNKLFGQVFGLYVNTGTTPNTAWAHPATIDLNKEAIQNILSGTVQDWAKVIDSSGSSVATTLAITLANREKGSGSRAAVSAWALGDNCTKGASGLRTTAAALDQYGTGDVLKRANTIAGAITYAGVDSFNATAQPNLILASINGVAPTNLNAAKGLYDFWEEAHDVFPATFTVSASQASMIAALEKQMQIVTSAPHTAQVLSIPGTFAGTTNTAAFDASTTADTNAAFGTATIYVNSYSRNGSACNVPQASF
jgi:hypothetical protein